jgi:hypothetical protein
VSHHSALGYLTPAAYVANVNATCDRLRNPDKLRRSHVAHPMPTGVTSDLKPSNWTVLARVFPLNFLGWKERSDEGIEVFGGSKGVHFEAGHLSVPVAEICRKAGISECNQGERRGGKSPSPRSPP